MSDSAVADKIISRLDKAKTDRTQWESMWSASAELILPRYADEFLNSNPTKGSLKTEKMLDPVGAQALERFAAIMESMLTPRNSKWHSLIPSNKELRKDREVRLWFEQVTDILFDHRYAPKANFASQNHEAFMQLGAFGTSGLFIDENTDGPGIRYMAAPLTQMYLFENHQGMIDIVYRLFKMTARQMVQRWGLEGVSEKIAKEVHVNPDKEFEVVHCVQPRTEDYMHGMLGPKGMPFASYYVEKESKKMLSEGGYQTFPYAVSRYVTAPGEVYGRGPATIALPSLKTLMAQKKVVLKQGHRAVDPVLFMFDDGSLSNVNVRPGTFNWGGVDAQGRPLVHQLPTGRVDIGLEMMNEEKRAVNEAFMVTLFQILVDSPQMTATEVMERAREKGALLAPTMGRQQSELLGPLIEREVDLLSRQGLLPPMPGILQEARGEYTIEYDSPLSRAQRAEEAAGLMHTLQMVEGYVNLAQDPAPLDHFDWDKITPALSDINAVPVSWRRGDQEIQDRRANRDQAAQDQQAMQQAPAMAAMMKNAQAGGGAGG